MIRSHSAIGISSDEKLRVLEELLQSETFSRSGRLRSLLRFLCESEIEGKESELTEYSIGVTALGRPAEFSPLEDSSVRSRAHELRQRLEKYYASEAPHATLRIELRKGSYVPRFVTARPEDLEGSAELQSSVPDLTIVRAAPSEKALRFRALSFLAGAVVMFALMAVWSLFRNPGVRIPMTRLETAEGDLWTPELEALWRPFFITGNPLLITYETRFFIRLGPLMVRDWHVNGPEGVESSEALTQVQKIFGYRRIGNRDYADGGTPQAIFSLSRLLSRRVPNMALKNALDLTAADLRDNNIILLGKPGMDPELERLLARGEIIDSGTGVRIVHPSRGEPAEYHDQYDPADPDRWGEKYSVISMMPGSFGGRRILSLTASGSEQPAALAYFMTNQDSTRDLVRRMTARGPIPQYFQVLVRAEYKSKAVEKVEYVTHRALNNPVR